MNKSTNYQIRYGDCTVKPLTGAHLSAAMRNLEKFHYAGTPLGVIRITGEFGCPVGEVSKQSGKGWKFTPDSSGNQYQFRQKTAGLMKDINSEVSR